MVILTKFLFINAAWFNDEKTSIFRSKPILTFADDSANPLASVKITKKFRHVYAYQTKKVVLISHMPFCMLKKVIHKFLGPVSILLKNINSFFKFEEKSLALNRESCNFITPEGLCQILDLHKITRHRKYFPSKLKIKGYHKTDDKFPKKPSEDLCWTHPTPHRTRIHWLDRQIVRKQLYIMPTYHYVQNQEKLMIQSRENGQKPQFGQLFDNFEVKYLQIASFSEK